MVYICQSSGMPLGISDDIGINADGSGSKDYCTYCYHKSEFLESALTVEEMILKSSEILWQQIGDITQEAKKIRQNIPNSKRWK